MVYAAIMLKSYSRVEGTFWIRTNTPIVTQWSCQIHVILACAALFFPNRFGICTHPLCFLSPTPMSLVSMLFLTRLIFHVENYTATTSWRGKNPLLPLIEAVNEVRTPASRTGA